jgi:hypothetical protein
MVLHCDSVILIYFFDPTGPFNARPTNRLGANPIYDVKN